MARSSSRIAVAAIVTGLAMASTAIVAGAQQPAPRPPARDSLRREMPRDMSHDANHDMHHEMGGPPGRAGMRAGMRPGMRAGMRPGMRGPGRLGHGMAMGGMRGGPGGIASMLLAQTAALKLSDQQVTRLAALARSAESQQAAVRASMDSLHRTMMSDGRPPAAMMPPQMTPAMEARMRAVHDQMHANTRDALAVLTPDQLASAWEMRGGAGRGARGMGPNGPRPD